MDNRATKRLAGLTILIISHTDHYLNEEGKPCGWTSTVKELDFLAGQVKKVIHLAVLHQNAQVPQSVSSYVAKNIEFVALPKYGGNGIVNKLRILGVVPVLYWKVTHLIKRVDYFQFRAPTSIGLFLIPFLTLFTRKKGWYKYAGNWMQPNMPCSYKIQKWLLENFQRRPVTINGKWARQKAHCYTFENPCLQEKDLTRFKKRSIRKSFSLPIEICFVGRLEPAKGVDRIVDLLCQPEIEEKIQTFHFIGDSEMRDSYESRLMYSKVDCVFHGFLPRPEVFKLYNRCHAFFLPSDSEGFPKVIAEAAAFGCIPFVSDVSSIGQYVNEENGFLWKSKQGTFTSFIHGLDMDENSLKKRHINVYQLAEKFTFERYLQMLDQFII